MVSTPQLSGLTTRLAAPARLLAMRFGRRKPSDTADAAPVTEVAAKVPDTTGLLDGRLHVPVSPVPTESAVWAETIAKYAELARQDRWAQVLKALHDADQARTSASGGRRLANLISQGARAELTAALQRADWTAAEAEIDRLSAILSAHPDSYVAAHLLAQAHLDLGWARRSAEPGPGLPRDVWQAFLHHTAMAEAAMEAFDPLEEMSPLLAGTRYFLVRGIEDGEALCRDWYEDWSDLDLTNPEPHAAHAAHLLPQWFGSLMTFDDEARAAMKRTAHCSGAAAYAVFYMSAADQTGALPPRMDLPLFLAGLMDHFRATGCQYRANIVAGAMTELDHAYSIEANPKSERARLVRETLTEHLRENLREFQLSGWENGEACIQYAVSTVFEKELARGEHIYVGPEGLTSRLPV